jgi:uncharacterized protein YkwD/LysM repeat protein
LKKSFIIASVQTRNILNIFLTALLIATLVLAAFPPLLVKAQAASAMDIISAVNAYRANNGLQPYDVDSGLMSLAQGQSEYQASIQTCTHNRADGSGPGNQGISAENIACGPDMNVQGAFAQWTDQVHTATMLGPDSGQVGAGVATAGNMVYYTLAVRRLTGEFIARPPVNVEAASQNKSQQANPTQPPAVSGDIVISTPNSDGSISHIIKYGETLVEIAKAYNIPLSELIGINKLDPSKPQYFAGQALLIRLAFTATPYMTATYTPRPPTRTPLPTRTPRATKTPSPDYTQAPTQTVTATPAFRIPTLDDLGPGRTVMAYAFVAISAIGLIVLIFTAFLPGKRG